MRFGLAHRLFIDSLVALGMLALATTKEIERPLALALVATLLLALAIPRRWQEHPIAKPIGTFLPLAILVAQLVRWFLGTNVIPLALEFTALLQISRVALRRGAAHDQQLVLLALLQLIAATVLGGGLTYAVAFLGFVLTLPPALVLSHLRREVEGNYRQGARDRTGLPVDVPRILRSRRVVGQGFLLFICSLALPIFVFTALLFVLFPRVGLSLLTITPPSPTRVVGFSDHVDLGGIGRLRTNPTIALRLYYPSLPAEPPPRLAVYLRGATFDRYDGRSWTRSSTARETADRIGSVVPLLRLPDVRRDSSFTIDLQPLDPPVLFVPSGTVALQFLAAAPTLNLLPTVQRGGDDELRFPELAERHGLRYRVYVTSTPREFGERLADSDRQRFLQLPADLSPRVRDLTKRWTQDLTEPALVARRLETRLRSDYRYDLDSPSGAAADPLDDFLFKSRRGHCEFYSTAMAVMLRASGIPARNVTGFASATFNRFGEFYAVRQGDAHSWVEAWLPTLGWTRFDPTPPASVNSEVTNGSLTNTLRDLLEAASQRWHRNVEGYDLHQQLTIVNQIRKQFRRFELPRESVRRGASGRQTRSLWAASAVVLIALAVAYLLWRRRRRAVPRQANRETAEQQEIVALYRALEHQLERLGCARPVAVPPLAHAKNLSDLRHPVGSDAVTLTEQYLHVRFGHQPLTLDTRREFATRLKQLAALDAAPRQRRASHTARS